MKKGIVVLGHGSRAGIEDANRVFFQVAELVKLRAGHELVQAAIMNRSSGCTTLREAVEMLISRGAEHVAVVPMFFDRGMHIKKDIPQEISEIQRLHPTVILTMTMHIGADERIADIIWERAQTI